MSSGVPEIRDRSNAILEFTELNRRRVFGNPGLSIGEVERWQELREVLSREYAETGPGEAATAEDRRSHVRHATHLRVHFDAEEHGIAVDVSLGGVFIATSRPLPIGSEISLELETPLLEAPMRMAGVVVRVEGRGALNHRSGMGIMFCGLEAEQCSAIKLLMGRLERAD